MIIHTRVEPSKLAQSDAKSIGCSFSVECWEGPARRAAITWKGTAARTRRIPGRPCRADKPAGGDPTGKQSNAGLRGAEIRLLKNVAEEKFAADALGGLADRTVAVTQLSKLAQDTFRRPT